MAFSPYGFGKNTAEFQEQIAYFTQNQGRTALVLPARP
jgi:hypothetical protein